MLQNLKLLLSHRELLWLWTMREIRIRYKQSVLGVLWAVLQPLSLVVIFSVVFSYFIRIPTGDIPYPIFSFTAMLPWTLLVTSLGFASSSLINNVNLVTKIHFPREILPISVIIASVIDFLITSVFLMILILYYGLPINLNTIIIAPILVVIQVLLLIGVALFLSATNVFYRDLRFVVPLGIQLWMYATPIIYPVTLVPERLRTLYMLNPMAVLIEAYRDILLRGTWPDWNYLGLATAMSTTLFVLGYIYFKKVEWQFADII